MYRDSDSNDDSLEMSSVTRYWLLSTILSNQRYDAHPINQQRQIFGESTDTSEAIEATTPVIQHTTSRTGYRRRITPQIELGHQLLEIEKEKIRERKRKHTMDINDGDVGYMNSILPVIKQLSPRDKLEYMIKSQQMLYSYLYKNKNGQEQVCPTCGSQTTGTSPIHSPNENSFLDNELEAFPHVADDQSDTPAGAEYE